MSREEINSQIQKLNRQRFYLAMKDYWTSSDYKKDEDLKKEIKNLEKVLDN